MYRPRPPAPVFKVPTITKRSAPVKKSTDSLNDTNQIRDNFQNLLDDSFFNNIDEKLLLATTQQSPGTQKLDETYNVDVNGLPSQKRTPMKPSPSKSQRRSAPCNAMSQRMPSSAKKRRISPAAVTTLNMTVEESEQEFAKLYSPDRDPELSPLPVQKENQPTGSARRIVFSDNIQDCFSDRKARQIQSMHLSASPLPTKSILKPTQPPTIDEGDDIFCSQQHVFPLDASDTFNLLEEATVLAPLDQNVNLDLTIDPEMADLLDNVEPTTEDYIFQDADDPYQSSQKFMADIRNSETFAYGTKTLVSKTIKAASVYMEMQKSMAAVNDGNVTDDIIQEKVTHTQLEHPSQYQRDLDAVFDQCERSIMLSEPNQLSKEAQEIDWSDEMSILAVHTQKPKSPPHVPHLVPVSSSPFCSMGPFFGLPLKVKRLIHEYKGIAELYDWQKECLRLPAVANRHNLIYALPTSGGKTLVAEILMLREIICRRKNVLFILPYVAIVQEKIWAMSPFAVGLEFLVEEYASGKGKCPPRKRRKKNSIFIATIEKSMSLIDSLIEEHRLDEIGLVVVDELHLLGEEGRGATLECVLTKLKFVQPSIQIVGMSATIGNLQEIGEFLNAKIYTRDFRPVELTEYLKCGDDLMEINSSAPCAEEAYKFSRKVDFGYTARYKQMDPDGLAGLVQEVIPDNSCLIFCSTKKNCEDVAVLISKLFQSDLKDYRAAERQALIEAIVRDTGTIMENMRQTILFGVAYHHSGLTSDERRLLEDAFRAGVLCVICCTSTLAAGVNLPCRRVIIRTPYVGREFMTQSKYKQMIGRAGRAGMGVVGESILICPPRDNLNVNNLILSSMDDANSSMHSRQNVGFRNLMLSAIGLGIATTRNELLQLSAHTLLAVQADKLGQNVKRLTDGMIKMLYQMQALTTKEDAVEQRQALKFGDVSVRIEGTQSETPTPNASQQVAPKRQISIWPNTPLEISKLGRAAFKAGLDLHKAHTLYEDLRTAQSSLVLTDYLHLLFLCTPYEEERKIDWRHYYFLLSRFNAAQYNTIRTIGIDETCLNRMHTGKAPVDEKKRIIYRFCVTLMLYDLWNNMPIHEVARRYDVPRGYVQNLMSQASTQASVNLRFCEELDEFWAFKQLFGVLIERLSYCCSAELVPLMALPAVKLGRAKQLYAAGYKNLDNIAAATPNKMCESIEHLNMRVAKQLISAAKVLLLEKVDSLREQAQDYLEILNKGNK